ncbi:MAG: branched-chain amino acid aminotransferase [Ignavibacteriaceae bacterium]|nr:branched-chain amino acid aminotransferase [Ignavibacteriaceae bacterium]
MNTIKYEIKTRTGEIRLPEPLGFGQIFTDHVFEMDYNPSKGWQNFIIKPLSEMSVHPATMFIHYGQALFEGMKAFRHKNNDVVLFRPDKHFVRLNNSARRLCMPEVDVNFVTEALKELVSIEKEWIPRKEGEALYIRPFMFGLDPVLGVKPAQSYKFIILLSPVGAYYPEGFKPVKILVQDDYVRAVRKGMGECKTPGNYAASLLASEMARKQGYTQVLWLDGVEQKYIEEVGTMNIFITFKDEVATPKLTGGILPGITRMSVLHILKDWGMNVTERLISLDELVTRFDKGEVEGVFGTGTAAIISSVGELKYKDRQMIINKGEPGQLAHKLFDTLTGMHSGKITDPYGWLVPVQQEVAVS